MGDTGMPTTCVTDERARSIATTSREESLPCVTLRRAMRKTSVYLSDREAEQLRRAAAGSGRPQSELIREGIRRVVGTTDTPRRFLSMGKGHGGGKPYRTWTSRALYRKVMGGR